MERAQINGITLEYEVQGSGDPVVLIHGGLGIADSFAPLMTEPALADRFTLIRYHRRGHAGSSKAEGPMSIARGAADCLTLLRHLGVHQAHVVGHSYGGNIALQLALDAPEAVRSLSLLEPGLADVPSGPKILEKFERAGQLYEAGDKAGAIDAGLQAVCGKGYRAALDAAVPGGFEQAVSDADTVFLEEGPAAQEWTFRREDAGRIKQPVLAVLGANSVAVFGEGHQRLLEWLPQAKPFVLPRAGHALQVENPGDMARGLAGFLSDN